jgi:hypothetical protein
MKTLNLILKVLLMILIVSGCSKNEENSIEKPQEKVILYESTGTIMGRDMALCACCGDWKIIIDNMVCPANIILPFVHQFKFLPANSNINLETATFPLNVKINWSIDNNICNGEFGRIVIDDIALN